MATDTKAGGAKARAQSSGEPPSQPESSSSGAGAAPDDEPIMGPLWARMAIGAAAVVVIAAAAQFALARGTSYTSRGEARVDKFLAFALVLAVPFLVNLAASVAADMARGVPRLALAAMTGAATLASAFVTFAMISAVTYFVAPLALVGGPLLRAVATRPRGGMRRADHILEWAFAGVFWPTLVAVGAGFLVRANVAANVGLPISAATATSLSVALGAAVLGAVLTWIYDALDAGLWSGDGPTALDDDAGASEGARDPAARGE